MYYLRLIAWEWQALNVGKLSGGSFLLLYLILLVKKTCFCVKIIRKICDWENKTIHVAWSLGFRMLFQFSALGNVLLADTVISQIVKSEVCKLHLQKNEFFYIK